MTGNEERTKFVLIGGYSQSGKNTFAISFQGNNDIAWKLLSRGPRDRGGHTLPTGAPCFETSFAFPLKKTVCERLSVPFEHVDDLKDVPLSFMQLLAQQPHWHCIRRLAADAPPTGADANAAGTSRAKADDDAVDPPAFATLRDVLIDEAAFQRRKDPDHYAAAAHGVVLKQRPVPATCLITDWRYPNECEYFRSACGHDAVVTIRVIRDGHRVSSAPSEHALDHFSPDFVAVPYTAEEGASNGVCDEVYFNGVIYTFSSVVNLQLEEAAKGPRGQALGHHDAGVDAGKPIAGAGVADD